MEIKTGEGLFSRSQGDEVSEVNPTKSQNPFLA